MNSNPINERQPGQLLGISVEDVASYMALVKDDVGIRHEDELVQAFLALAEKVHPLALGNVKRSTSQSRMMGEKLLKTRKAQDLDEHDISEIIGKLSSQLFYHGHPISRREAREDLGLTFVKDPPGEVESAMWQLFELYEEDLRLNEPLTSSMKRSVQPTVLCPLHHPVLYLVLEFSIEQRDSVRTRLFI